MNIFSEEQRKKLIILQEEYHQNALLLRSLFDEIKTGGIKANNPNADAILDGILKHLNEKAQKCQQETLPFSRLMDEYNKERDRIARDFDDDFLIKPETIAALDELTEQYREKAAKIGEQEEILSKPL